MIMFELGGLGEEPPQVFPMSDDDPLLHDVPV
jgi:hypothetical protein